MVVHVEKLMCLGIGWPCRDKLRPRAKAGPEFMAFVVSRFVLCLDSLIQLCYYWLGKSEEEEEDYKNA